MNEKEKYLELIQKLMILKKCNKPKGFIECYKAELGTNFHDNYIKTLPELIQEGIRMLKNDIISGIETNDVEILERIDLLILGINNILKREFN